VACFVAPPHATTSVTPTATAPSTATAFTT
jgi:hypothetical protein